MTNTKHIPQRIKGSIRLIIQSICLFLSPYLVTAQNDSEQANVFRRIQVGINFSSDYCYRSLQTDDASVAFIVDLRNESEIPKFGYNTGANFYFNLNRNFGLQTGIQYSNKGYRMDEKQIIIYPYNGEYTSFESVYSFHRIDIPVIFNLLLGKKKLQFIAGLGAIANLFISETSKSTIHYSDGTKEVHKNNSSDDYEFFNLSPMASLGIDLMLYDRLNLRVEPIFRYNVMSIIDAPIRGYLWSAGVNTSLLYRF